MPRPRKVGGPEPKKRSRTGCWPCKARKVKCGEEKPQCVNCERQGEQCDYSIRLNWGGRTKKKGEEDGLGGSMIQFASPSTPSFPTIVAPSQPSPPVPSTVGQFLQTSQAGGPSPLHTPSADATNIDPSLMKLGPTQQSLGGTLSPMANTSSFQFYTGPKPLKSPLPASSRSAGRSPFESGAQAPGPRHPAYPSPTASNLEGQSNSAGPTPSALKSPVNVQMPPPVRGIQAREKVGGESTMSPANRAKRIKLSPSGSPPVVSPALPAFLHESGERPSHAGFAVDVQSPNTGPMTPYSPAAGTPLTPNSSIASEDGGGMKQGPTSVPVSYQASDPRRMSVESILSSPKEGSQGPHRPSSRGQKYPIANDKEGTTTYGYDVGEPDYDTPKNKDENAIMVVSPQSRHGFPVIPNQEDTSNAEFGFGLQSKDIAFERGPYYAKPVPINIPHSLEPLPNTLLENPMNLLYFHHFMNHTARILVPHDCEENPFRNILPAMALKDENLLNLLLAYSASHRARLLKHPEPVNRMAVWVQDVFPRLRGALDDNTRPISNEDLTAAIMLASLEIISPNAFEVPISWQNHLMLARQMMIARGGPKAVQRRDKVSYFLSRWFAYLDILGSLSGRMNARPMSSMYWSNDELDEEGDFQIDCLLGFTGRCVGILARIAELAKQCEPERIGENGEVKQDWRPSFDVAEQAERLKVALQESRERGSRGCTHRSAEWENSQAGCMDSMELYATNDAYHWAGLIHLFRRVLGVPMTHPEVQDAVQKIVGGLHKVRQGSTAEACLLFPIFTAGCDSLDQNQRETIMERLKGMEEFGMTQVRHARGLMEVIWETGKPWETLVSGEFVG